jgi:hypothetical protein
MESDDTSSTNVLTGKKRERNNRPFPSSPFKNSLDFARAAYEWGSGTTVRRLSLFDHLKKSPESSASRELITNASKYGLIKGNFRSDSLELTDQAKVIFEERSKPRDVARTKIDLAIQKIPVFSKIYEAYIDRKLPTRSALIETANSLGVPTEHQGECIDTFLLNLQEVKLLMTLSGAERILSIEHLSEQLPDILPNPHQNVKVENSTPALQQDKINYDEICFYVTPIGHDGSNERKHSDLFFNFIVEPALDSFGLKVVRADQIAEPGMIPRQIFDYLAKSRLVIADLSYHNPNVFYELAVRHVLKRPAVQICRAIDKIPFDINQMRTIVIDDSDIYSLLPKIDVYKSEIATQARLALEQGWEAENPVSISYPNLKIMLT